MPLDFEDGTDISGSPPPVRARSPSQVHGDTAQKVNQNRRGPQVQQDGGGIGGFFSGLGSRAHQAVSDPGQTAKDVAGGVGQFALGELDAHNPMHLIDWGQEVERDAASAWAFGRRQAGILSGQYHDGVHAFYQADDTNSRLLQLGAFGFANAIGSAYDSLTSPIRAAAALDPSQLETPQMAAERRSQQAAIKNVQAGDKAGEEQVVQDVPGQAFALGSLALPGGGVGGRALLLAAQAMPELFQGDQDSRDAALAWLGVAATLFPGGRLTGPLKDVLRKRFGAWDEHAGQLDDLVAQQQRAAEAASDPEKMQGMINQHIQQKLEEAAQAPHRAGLQSLVEPLEGEPAFRDPSGSIKELDADGQKLADRHMARLAGVLTSLKSGLRATYAQPFEMVGQAMAGKNRRVERVFDDYFKSLDNMLGKRTRSEDIQMRKAAEGDMAAYEGLRPGAKIAVDSGRLVYGALREMSEDTNYAHNFWANYWPRLDEEVPEVRPRGRPGEPARLAREARRHRAVVEQVDADGNSKLVQKYPTVQSANQAIRQQRSELVTHLLDSAQPLRNWLERMPEAAEIRRMVHGGQLEDARTRAVRLANAHRPLKDESWFDSFRRHATYQARAITTQKGLEVLSKTLLRGEKEGDPIRTGTLNINGLKQPQIEAFLNQGYKHIDDPKFRNWVFDHRVADMINRHMRKAADLGLLEGAVKFNRELLRITMYSPHIHGANIARRYGALGFSHPMEFARFVKGRKGLLAPYQLDDEAEDLRNTAQEFGMMPPRGANDWASNFSDQISTGLGDIGDHVHFDTEPTSRVGKMMRAIGESAPVRGYKSYEDGFWHWVNDFGTTAFHVEWEALKHGGMDATKAGFLAAQRANSWMGMVLPENTNPTFHKLASLALFAPNWWRTLGELMVPIYRRSGIFESPKDVRRAVGMGLKTTAAMFGAMKVSGELFNHMLSGHSQAENQPGHQDDIEIRSPGVLHALQRADLLPQGVDPNTGVNPKNGAHVYFRIGGQFEDVLQAAGFESGHSGHHVLGPLSVPAEGADVQEGMTRFAAARLSPLMSFVPALANVDVYRTWTQGGSPRALVPGTQAGQIVPPNPLAVMLTIMQSTPGGQGLSQVIQDNQSRDGADSMSLFGTKVPTSLGEYGKALKLWAERFALTGLLGVNPPYASAERTRGTAVPDADYQKVKELTDTYNRQQQTLGAEMLSGQKTPKQWLDTHRKAAADHSSAMKALFHNAPEYLKGSSGMAADWESLYEKATNPDGTLDQAKLGELQAQFRSQHTADEMRQMQSTLRQRDGKDSALHLYHATLDAADKWEEQWAAQQGLDVTTLRKENSEYNRLGTADKRKYLQQHGELRRLRTAIQRQFYKTPQGMLYALYRGDNQTVLRYLKAHHLSPSDLEQEVEQQGQAA